MRSLNIATLLVATVLALSASPGVSKSLSDPKVQQEARQEAKEKKQQREEREERKAARKEKERAEEEAKEAKDRAREEARDARDAERKQERAEERARDDAKREREHAERAAKKDREKPIKDGGEKDRADDRKASAKDAKDDTRSAGKSDDKKKPDERASSSGGNKSGDDRQAGKTNGPRERSHPDFFGMDELVKLSKRELNRTMEFSPQQLHALEKSGRKDEVLTYVKSGRNKPSVNDERRASIPKQGEPERLAVAPVVQQPSPPSARDKTVPREPDRKVSLQADPKYGNSTPVREVLKSKEDQAWYASLDRQQRKKFDEYSTDHLAEIQRQGRWDLLRETVVGTPGKLRDFGAGAVHGARGAVTSFVETVSDPLSVVDGLASTVRHPIQTVHEVAKDTVSAVRDGATGYKSAIKNGDTRAAGVITGSAALELLPVKKATLLTKLGNGPGTVVQRSESMSKSAAEYQTRAGGLPTGHVYVVNGVNFDGFSTETGVLIETKDKYSQFVADGRFNLWWTGADDLVTQAIRQRKAAGDTPIEWRFSEAASAEATRQLLNARGINGINIVHFP